MPDTNRESPIARRFANAARAWGTAVEAGDSDEADTQYASAIAIYRELEMQGTDALAQLVPLLQSDDPSVSIAAATILIDRYPDLATAALRIGATIPDLRGFTAKRTLEAWEAGRIKPL